MFKLTKHIIVSNIQIACEIDIRTLTSHQVLGQISDTFPTHFRHISDTFPTHFRYISDTTRFLTRFLRTGKYSVQVYWDRKYSVQPYWDRKKGYTLTTIVFSGPTRKAGYPLTTNYTTKLYLFVNDYIPV